MRVGGARPRLHDCLTSALLLAWDRPLTGIGGVMIELPRTAAGLWGAGARLACNLPQGRRLPPPPPPPPGPCNCGTSQAACAPRTPAWPMPHASHLHPTPPRHPAPRAPRPATATTAGPRHPVICSTHPQHLKALVVVVKQEGAALRACHLKAAGPLARAGRR